MSPSKSKRGTTRPTAGPNASARARLQVEQARAQRERRRLILVIVPIAVVLVAVGAFVIIRFTGNQNTAAPTTTADAGVITAVTGVPSSVLDQVGAGTVTTPPQRVDAPALTADGKPRVLYVGAEFCPYCAAERWAVVAALSRFGTFANLGQTTSSAQDVYPSTPTLSFHGSTYSSSTISFTGIETRGNQLVNGQYPPLDTLSGQDEQIFTTYNSPPYVAADAAGSIPFVDLGGTFLIHGASYDLRVLQGKTHAEIAAALSDPNSDIAKAVLGSANVITAALCTSTGNQPTQVCTSAGVTAGAAKLQ